MSMTSNVNDNAEIAGVDYNHYPQDDNYYPQAFHDEHETADEDEMIDAEDEIIDAEQPNGDGNLLLLKWLRKICTIIQSMLWMNNTGGNPGHSTTSILDVLATTLIYMQQLPAPSAMVIGLLQRLPLLNTQ